jgi:hypothetical protein
MPPSKKTGRTTESRDLAERSGVVSSLHLSAFVAHARLSRRAGEDSRRASHAEREDAAPDTSPTPVPSQ